MLRFCFQATCSGSGRGEFADGETSRHLRQEAVGADGLPRFFLSDASTTNASEESRCDTLLVWALSKSAGFGRALKHGTSPGYQCEANDSQSQPDGRFDQCVEELG